MSDGQGLGAGDGDGDTDARAASAEVARELASLWSTMSRRHVALGAGCSCGIGGVSLQLGSFEQDIVDYVVAEAEKFGRADVLAFLDDHARADADSGWSISLLLDSLADVGSGTAAAAEFAIDGEASIASFVLERLGRTLRSFAQEHGGG